MIVGGEYNYLLDRPSTDPNVKLLSICIPVYKEHRYLKYTLDRLMDQVLVKNNYVQIVIGEYKDDYGDKTVEDLCSLYDNVKYIHVNKRGISYARNMCVMNSVNPVGSGFEPIPFLMNMDADAYFQYDTGTYYMLLPLLENKNLMLANCEIIYPTDTIRQQKAAQAKTIYEYIYKVASDIGTLSERLVTARGPGMTFRRVAFDTVKGFRENRRMGEDYWFAYDVCYHYTWDAKLFIDNVKIIASDRRIKGANKDGIVRAFNYKKSYR